MMLLEQLQIAEGFPPVDLQTGANNGDYVNMANYNRLLILFASGLGTAGDDPTLTVQQATSAAGGSAKALNFTTLYKKQAATSLASTGQWTKVTQAAANTYTNDTSAEQAVLWAVEFKAEELDVNNGFCFVRATVADVGSNAQPGYLLYILGEPRDPAAPESMLSALA